MLYIAYGSNLNREQMARRCPTATLVGPAELPGYDLLFRGRRHAAVATVEPLERGSVPVLLWELKGRDEQSLDRFEGWPYVYRKELALIEFKGSTLPATTYIMNTGREFGEPSPQYLDIIRDGYLDAGFDLDYLDNAVEWSVGQALERDREWEMEQLQFGFGEIKFW